MRPNATAFVLVTLAAAVYTASVAAQAITFNVPYTCPDGMTYVVERCEMRGRVEVCYLERWKKNLQIGVPRARIVDLPGAGHYVFLTREAVVLRAVREFVADLH